MAYAIEFRAAARRNLANLPRRIRRLIRREIDALADTPRPAHAIDMWGEWEGFLRVPVGEYRVIYVIDDPAERVTIARVGHRSEVYDDRLSPYA